MGNLKIITTDEFVEKFDKDMLEDEDLKAIYFQRTFEDTLMNTILQIFIKIGKNYMICQL